MKSKYRSVLIKLPVRWLWRHDMTIITSNLTESWFHSGLNQAFNYTSSVGFWSRTKTNHVLSKWYWESLKNITRWPIFEIWMQKYLSLFARVHVLHCCIVTHAMKSWNLWLLMHVLWNISKVLLSFLRNIDNVLLHFLLFI